MRNCYLGILSFFLSVSATAQCPYIAGIFVDACGQENRNEFIFLLNGNAPLNVDDLAITFPTNGSVTVANTTDFSVPAVTSATHIGSCLTLLNNGGVIPANAPVIIFMSNDVQQAYDFTSWCTQYGTVYLLYRNLTPVTPTFANTTASGGTDRTASLSIGLAATCAASYTYTLPGLSTDGNFYRFPEPVAGVSLSPGSVNNGCASPPFVLLPVKLKSFTANLTDGAAVLTWITVQEDNVAYFDIEKSTGAGTFSSIARVQATGHSTGEISYTYTDQHPGATAAQYRLRMADLDGRSEYSGTVRIQPGVTGFALLGLYPNPVAKELIIEWNARRQSPANMIITDIQGRIIFNKPLSSNAGYNQTRLPVSMLSSGTYYLRLTVDREVITQKFIRQ